jgi:hypothetical protein
MAKLNFKEIVASKTKNALGSSIISLEAIKQKIEILDDLKSFIPPPNDDEIKQLEANILQHGCKDALIVWETTQAVISTDSVTPNEPTFILVDGHNRFQICQKHNLTFSIQLKSFPSVLEVKDYMIDLQLGRRNLTPQQASYFRGLRYQNEKNAKGKYDRENHKVQNEPYGSTAEKLAQEYKVSVSTIKRDALLAEGLEKLAQPLKNQVLAGEISIDKKTIHQLAKLPIDVPKVGSIKDITTTTLPTNELIIEPKKVVEETLELLSMAVNKLAKSRKKQHLQQVKKLTGELEKLL